MKKIIVFFLSIAIFLPIFAQAATQNLIIDQGHLFSSQDIANFKVEAEEINKKINGEIFILTVSNHSEKAGNLANKELKARVGEKGNGALLLIDMGKRKFHIATAGKMSDYLANDRADKITEKLQNDLKNNNFSKASKTYTSEIKKYVTEGFPKGKRKVDEKTGKVTYSEGLTAGKFFVCMLFSAMITGLIVFFIRRRYKLKSVNYQYQYRENSSFDLQNKSDEYLRASVTSRVIQSNSNNSSDSSDEGTSF